MTIQQKYKECERLFTEIDWKNPATVARYQEAVKELEKMREEERRNEK